MPRRGDPAIAAIVATVNQSSYTMGMNTATVQTARPPTGTQEWAASNVNIQDGCEHDCRYCYAKTMAIRFKRATPISWKRPRLRQHDLERSFTSSNSVRSIQYTLDLMRIEVGPRISVFRQCRDSAFGGWLIRWGCNGADIQKPK